MDKYKFRQKIDHLRQPYARAAIVGLGLAASVLAGVFIAHEASDESQLGRQILAIEVNDPTASFVEPPHMQHLSDRKDREGWLVDLAGVGGGLALAGVGWEIVSAGQGVITTADLNKFYREADIKRAGGQPTPGAPDDNFDKYFPREYGEYEEE